jgi:hypothetical protein
VNTLYFIGGAARAGKTILASKLLQEQKLPYFGIDYFTGALQTEPELGISHKQGVMERAEKLWSFIRALSENLLFAEPRYLLDGEALFPKYLYEYRNAGKNIKACFLGYANISPEEKFKIIRANPSPVNDWSRHTADDELMNDIREGISLSRYLQEECANINSDISVHSLIFQPLLQTNMII